MGRFNNRYSSRFKSTEAQAPKKAATQKPTLELPTAANNYHTHTYGFARPMKQPEDWLAEPDERRLYRCDHHGGCMHETKGFIRAQDYMATSKGELPPSIAEAQAVMENKSMEGKQEYTDQSTADKETLHRVQLQWCYWLHLSGQYVRV
jgi:hypothetical protein